jgi:uncharacterized phage protein gp47/JayE
MSEFASNPLPFKIDSRDSQQFYQTALNQAETLCKKWSWPAPAGERETDDAGLALLQVFGLLSAEVATRLNQVPAKCRMAFYDFLALTPLPFAQATVPLSYALASGHAAVSIPAHSGVSIPGNQALVFTTTSSLNVLPLTLVTGTALDAPRCRYFMLSAEQLAGNLPISFTLTNDSKDLDHLLFLEGDDYFYAVVSKLSITCKGFGLTPEFFSHWYSSSSPNKELVISGPVQDRKDVLGRQLTLTMSALSPPQPALQSTAFSSPTTSSLTSAPQSWLALRAPPELFAGVTNDNSLPYLSSITIDRVANNLLPDHVFVNNSRQDPTQGFYPFGKRPVANDCLYLDVSAFSQQNLSITLSFTIDLTITPAVTSSTGTATQLEEAQIKTVSDHLKITSPTTKMVSDGIKDTSLSAVDNTHNPTEQIAIECWDDTSNQWVPISTITSNANCFLSSGPATITIGPLNVIPACTVNQISAHWLRFRLCNTEVFGNPDQISIIPVPFSGSAGLSAAFTTAINLDLETLFPNPTSPIQLTAQEVSKILKTVSISSGYVINRPGATIPFMRSLTISVSDTWTANDPHDQRLKLSSYNVFIAREQLTLPVTPFSISDIPARLLAFGFAVGENLSVLAGTEFSFYFSGKQSDNLFNSPKDNISITWMLLGNDPRLVNAIAVESIADGTNNLRQAGIIRLRLPEAEQLTLSSPFGLGIGSKPLLWLAAKLSSDLPNLYGIFANSVMAHHSTTVTNEQLGVSNGSPAQAFHFSRSPLLPGTDLTVTSSTSTSSPTVTKDDHWHEVSTLTFSGPRDRHYLLDQALGVVRFGDSVHGMVPPNDSIITAQRYEVGGGLSGNVAAQVLTNLNSSIPGIASVTNPVPAIGGANGEGTGPRFLQRCARSLRDNNRAVCMNDFAALAIQSSPDVVRASAVAVENDPSCAIRVYILSYGSSVTRPLSLDLATRVTHYLQERALVLMRDRIAIAPPQFTSIALSMSIQLSAGSDRNVVTNAIQTAIKAYLDPLSGGDQGDGWPFAASIHSSKLAQLVARIPGVAAVRRILIDGHLQVILSPAQIPSPTQIQFTMDISYATALAG